MKYRELGRTGWQVSEISFGAWAIGGAWGDGGCVLFDKSIRMHILRAHN